MRSIFFGQAAAARQALQSRKSGQRMFSKQHLMASTALAPGSFQPVPDDAIAGAFHDAGSDRQSARPAEVAAHSVPVGLAGADAVRDGFGPVAMRLQGGDGPVDPPGIQLLPDPLHPRLPLALVRRRGLHGVGRIFEGVVQVEDEGRFPSGQDLLADGPDPRRPIGQHNHFLGREHAVPVHELLQAGGEARPAPFTACALSVRTPAAPLFRSFRGSPVFGSRLSAARQTMTFAAPSACLPATLSTSRAAIGTPVSSISSRTRAAGGDASASSRSNACISSPILVLWRWRVAFDTVMPARFPSLRTASS